MNSSIQTLAPDRLDWITADPQAPRQIRSRPADFQPLPAHFATQHPLRSVEEVAARHPDRVVVMDGAQTLTYAEILDRVYGLARRIEAETPTGAPMAVLIHNTVAAPIAFLACAAAARVVIPIDASHPLERQAALFADARAGGVLLQSGAKVDDSFLPAKTPRLVFDPAAATGAARFEVEDVADPDRPLGVVYTSGSTGRPKGLAFSQSGALRSITQQIQTSAISPSDVILGLASLSTAGPSDFICALLTGARVRLVDLKALGLAEGLRILEEEGITMLAFVPTVLRMVMQMEGIERAFRSLRLLDLRGEAALASDIALFRSKLPPTCEISVCLASTEAMFVYQWFVRDDQIEGPVVPVGYLVPGKAVALIDEDGKSVGPGEVGEALVRGVPMAAGAWREGRVVMGPFIPAGEGAEGRIYPLGDLLRHRPDGLAEFVGRRDRQVKIRGLWADLGEVEAALRSAPGVTDAVVITRQTGAEAVLIAFITIEAAKRAPSPTALRRRVAAETAEHMAPAKIYVLDELPRLANYKPDLIRLDALAATPPRRDRAKGGGDDV